MSIIEVGGGGKGKSSKCSTDGDLDASSGSAVEDLLREVERQIKNQSPEGVALHFDSPYSGSGFLSPPPVSVREESIGPVRVRSWKGESSGKNESPSSFPPFLLGLFSVTDVRIKLLRLEGFRGEISLDMTGRRASGDRFHRTEIYQAEWKKGKGGKWLFSTLRRLSGRWLESSRLLFEDRTEALGLRLTPSVKRKDLPLFMEPFSFLGGDPEDLFLQLRREGIRIEVETVSSEKIFPEGDSVIPAVFVLDPGDRVRARFIGPGSVEKAIQFLQKTP